MRPGCQTLAAASLGCRGKIDDDYSPASLSSRTVGGGPEANQCPNAGRSHGKWKYHRRQEHERTTLRCRWAEGHRHAGCFHFPLLPLFRYGRLASKKFRVKLCPVRIQSRVDPGLGHGTFRSAFRSGFLVCAQIQEARGVTFSSGSNSS